MTHNPIGTRGLIPTGQEIAKMSREEMLKWAKIVLNHSQKREDTIKLAIAMGCVKDDL
jgi:hypothetical protein